MPRRERGRRSQRGIQNRQPSDHDVVTGKISRGQLVSTFGVGSLYEMRAYTKSGQWVTSVIIGGLDEWEICLDHMETIREPVLEQILRVGYFVEPPEESGKDNQNSSICPSVPVNQFPKWLVCSDCERLGSVGFEFRTRAGVPGCQATSCSGHGIPVRLIVTCFEGDNNDAVGEPHPGHIDDFPWNRWAHSQRESWKCEGQSQQLKLVRTGQSAGLSGLRVECQHPKCKQEKIGRSLDGVFGKDALHGMTCRGKRPWLKDEESCERPVRALMRGASNVYFPVVASALSIPPNSTACINEVGRIWRKSVEPFVKAKNGDVDIETIIKIVKNASPILRKFPESQVKDAITDQLGGDNEKKNLPSSESAQRAHERVAIVEGRTDCDENQGICLFEAERVADEDIGKSGEKLLPFTENLVLIHRLREVRALRGFQRLKELPGDSYTVPCAPIARAPKRWLPAIQVLGEGIYFELKPELVRDWSELDAVRDRFEVVNRRFQKKYGEDVRGAVSLSPGFILVHTLAHLLINQLSLDCGYSTASLRERIYVQNSADEQDWFGFLIYTASSSADGTLGGLVRQGEPDLFSSTFQAAIENAMWCSSDPLCIESEGQGIDALNRAACHACCITSETSCENRNLFLDRGFVTGTLDNPEVGFFHGVSFATKQEQ